MQAAERDIALTKALHIFLVAEGSFPIFPPSDCLRVSRMEWPFKSNIFRARRGRISMLTLFFFNLFCSTVSPRISAPPCELSRAATPGGWCNRNEECLWSAFSLPMIQSHLHSHPMNGKDRDPGTPDDTGFLLQTGMRCYDCYGWQFPFAKIGRRWPNIGIHIHYLTLHYIT